MDIAKGEQNAPAFRKLNPLGKVPVLVDSEGPAGVPITLAQSGAILMYCARKSGRFVPTDPVKRWLALQWMIHAVTDGSDAVGGIFRARRLGGPGEATLALYQGHLRNVLKNADAHLTDREYLADELSIADFALYTIVTAGRDLVGIDALAGLKRWLEVLSKRPALLRGMAVPG